MLRRVLLFIATNVLVIATISILISILGLNRYLTAHGLDYVQLAVFCGIWGTAGAFISLLMSKFMAKMAMGLVIIDPHTATREELFLLDIVRQLAYKAGLRQVPEVGIYSSPELNAFATGPSRNNALVAVSSGLLQHLNKDEIEAVLGHEISHVANGDMVTMTLVQGIINAFALFLSRSIAYVISMGAKSSDENNEFSYATYSILTVVFDILFTLLGSILVASYSRWREYRADAGGAKLAGRAQMIAALHRLQQGSELEDHRAPSLAALKISHQHGFLDVFASHPPIEKRIERLQQLP